MPLRSFCKKQLKKSDFRWTASFLKDCSPCSQSLSKLFVNSLRKAFYPSIINLLQLLFEKTWWRLSTRLCSRQIISKSEFFHIDFHSKKRLCLRRKPNAWNLTPFRDSNGIACPKLSPTRELIVSQTKKKQDLKGRQQN